MIAMLISAPSMAEMEAICVFSKELTADLSDEKLVLYRCHRLEEVRQKITKKQHLDLICVDITVPGALELVQYLRMSFQMAYLILIASMQISPVLYMKPSIRAESLILKPFEERQAQEVLKEAFKELLKRKKTSDKRKNFVIDNQDGRIVIPLEDILFFEARNKKIYANTEGEEYGFYGAVEQLEKSMKGNFIRCHRGFLVNVGKIKKILLSRNIVILEGDYEIPVSRTYRSVLKGWKGGE